MPSLHIVGNRVTQLTLARQLGEVVSDGLQERGFEVDGYEGPDDYYLA